ncbi:hypothetical protein QR680_003497 [Steinernema hermaphroditum]|uniref:Ground-like domain-containing protein n=1 Tax=Steinernema hermaphroditum TaxID=289476 RepID=A0AA39HLL2_9BILA|nr:hypothetical protein QR680_003497 [Steinernema hermaphroditum]
MMSSLLFLCVLLASSWAYCPSPCGGGCASRCGSLGLPPPRLIPQPYYPSYPRGQLPYPQASLYPEAYYQPKSVAIKETAVIRKPTTESVEEDYAVTPPPKPYEENTESSVEVFSRPEPVPLYPQVPKEIIQTGPVAPAQPYSLPVACPTLPYPPARPIYPQPLPQPIPQPAYPYPQPYPQPQPIPYPSRPPYPSNDCCARCPAPCRFRNRRFKAYDAKNMNLSDITAANNPKCSSDKLKTIMKKNMVDDLTTAKRLIQKAAEEKFGVGFNVICSRDDFTYVSRSTHFCLLESDGNLCYAFQSE